MNSRIELSVKTVLMVLGILASLWVLIQIRDILYLLFIAFLIMTAINPLVVFLEQHKVPRIVGIFLAYIVVIGVFGVVLASSIPALIIQTTRLVQALPGVIMKFVPNGSLDFSTVGQQLAPIGENLIKFILSIFSNIATVVTVLVFAFYFLLERRHTEQILTQLVGVSIAHQVVDILRAIEYRLGEWVRGELLLMISVGVLSYIGLIILHVEYALPLALVAATLEIVPTIGPIISAVPAILVGLGTSPFLALTVAALYIIVQQLENNLLVPIVMRKSVGFSPLIIILALMIGGRLAGITGVLLAVPVLLIIQVLFHKLVIKAPIKSVEPTKNPSKS
jgi:predicted PurR-regulated permease PerM